MSLNRFVSKALPLARRNVMLNQVRHHETIVASSPPTKRIPFTEKVVLGTIMCVAILAGPAWVLLNVQNYNAKKED